ncbi:hypothetical protein [Exiguobacterium acetylicum]|uniref:hypothetical protein n=1 Tax=Exiguobacterium acetylicum TaxID=41170 RepID=UPI001CA6BEA0|nr:hypothetical protein [Exiguobacterium acetylicum]QZY88661.1 hypothetical protein K7G97_17285 [Exiguobacterium acetylicum]
MKLKKVSLVLLTAFLLTSTSVAEANTVSVGDSKQNAVNIQDVEFIESNGIKSFLDSAVSRTKGKVPIHSWKDLEGKMITSDAGKVVKLIDANHNGEVIVTESKQPTVFATYRTVGAAVQNTNVTSSAIKACGDTDWLSYVKSVGVPTVSYKISGKTYNLNASLSRKYRLLIYGTPQDVNDSSYGNDYSSGQWRYLGYSRYGGLMINEDYPEYIGISKFDADLFLKSQDYATRVKYAYAMKNVFYSPKGAMYDEAIKTMGYFSWLGKKLLDYKSGSWWLKNEDDARIRIQSLRKGYEAGLAVTQYRDPNTGVYWYQAYIVKALDFPECPEPDMKADSLSASRSSNNVNLTFKVQNASPDKQIVTSKVAVPWSVRWNFDGIDAKGKSVSKSGTLSTTKLPKYGKSFPYGKVYSKTYGFNPSIATSWAGVFKFTAEFNPNGSKDMAEESYANNSASTSLSWSPKNIPPPKPGTCQIEDIDPPEYRYEYELDLSVERLEAKTTDKNTTTTTPISVYRSNYASNRSNAKNAINADLSSKKATKKSQELKKAQYETELVTLNKKLADAKKGDEVESCVIDGNGKEQCTTKTVVNPAAVNAAQAAVNSKQTQINEMECDIGQTDQWIDHYEKELGEVNSDEAKYSSVNPNLTVKVNNETKAETHVSLKEGERKVVSLSWEVEDDSNVIAEINEDGTYEEFVEGVEDVYANNVRETTIYIPSREVGMCGPTSEASGPVITVSDSILGDRTYIETLKGSINSVFPSRLRAGYGFTYNVDTQYFNEYQPLYNGTAKNAAVQYEYSANNLDTMQGLDRITDTGQFARFVPRSVYVSRNSGVVFSSNNPAQSPEELIDGGRKWYSNFEQKDGKYPFEVNVGRGGVNELGLCLTSGVEIKGTAMDDFVRRSVSPSKPFPTGNGWDWTGKSSIISGLVDWVKGAKL